MSQENFFWISQDPTKLGGLWNRGTKWKEKPSRWNVKGKNGKDSFCPVLSAITVFHSFVYPNGLIWNTANHSMVWFFCGLVYFVNWATVVANYIPDNLMYCVNTANCDLFNKSWLNNYDALCCMNTVNICINFLLLSEKSLLALNSFLSSYSLIYFPCLYEGAHRFSWPLNEHMPKFQMLPSDLILSGIKNKI